MTVFSKLCSRFLIPYLNKASDRYRSFSSSDPEKLRPLLEPCDILLFEGNKRISTAIKYLTQSTWSHAAMYVGDALHQTTEDGKRKSLIEADFSEGVIGVPLSKYADLNVRICRAVDLRKDDSEKIVRFMVSAIGMAYDTENVIDLMRYLIPTPPVPARWRRQLLALGSGDPTRAICSSLIAQAFQSVRYPILPEITLVGSHGPFGEYNEHLIHHIRHHSLFTPRDFDLSPYFEVIKPTLVNDFDYTELKWDED